MKNKDDEFDCVLEDEEDDLCLDDIDDREVSSEPVSEEIFEETLELLSGFLPGDGTAFTNPEDGDHTRLKSCGFFWVTNTPNDRIGINKTKERIRTKKKSISELETSPNAYDFSGRIVPGYVSVWAKKSNWSGMTSSSPIRHGYQKGLKEEWLTPF